MARLGLTLALVAVCLTQPGCPGFLGECSVDTDCPAATRCDTELGVCFQVPLAVTITSPAATVHTNSGTLTLTIEVTGGAAETLELLKDEQPIAVLTPPYQYSWSTAPEPEASYQLKARAHLGRGVFDSAPLTVVVDRTSPTVASRVPASPPVIAANVWVRDPVLVIFSEPMLPASATAISARLEVVANSAVLPTEASFSDDGRTLALEITSDVSVPSALRGLLTSGLTDLAGNALTVPGGDWRWNLPIWVYLGNGALDAVHDPSTPASRPSLALTRDDVPVLAWTELQGPANNIHVMRWSGAEWEPLGGGLSANEGSTSALHPSLALRSDGNPIVAWYEHDGTVNNIYVSQWNGTAWVSLGGTLSASADPGSNAFLPSLIVDREDRPILSWHEETGTPPTKHVYVQRWTGTAWVPMGPTLGTLESGWPDLALGSDDRPIVAWSEDGGAEFSIVVRRWSGSAWEPLGSPLGAVGATDTAVPSLAMGADGQPLVAWVEGDVYVRRWNGSAWVAVGGSISAVASAGTDGQDPSLAVGSDNLPVVAWHENDPSVYNIYVRKWTGSSWAPMGGDSAAEKLSAEPGNTQAFLPSLKLTASGSPVVAWQEGSGSGSNNNLYAQRWNR